jgi:hypothetical protein
MNTTHKLMLSALAALSIGSASASVTYISGSTAFEAKADAAITNFIAANFGTIIASDNATLGSEVNLIVDYSTNGSSGTATNLIIAHWNGSEAGIQSIDAVTNTPQLIGFYATNATGGLGGGGTNTPNLNSASIAFSDTYAVSSQFRPGTFRGIVYGSPSSDTVVAAQGFAFFGSKGFPVANVTAQQAQALYAAAYAALALFTGSVADETNAVFAVGRNFDSGTRIQAMSQSGVGGNATVQQVEYTSSNTVILFPAGTVDGVPAAAGNNGYSSTGSLLGALTNTAVVGTSFDQTGNIANGDNTGTNYLVGYAAASKIPTANTVALTYNGTTASTANITNGLYTFWGYEHVLASPFYCNAAGTNVYNSLVSYLTNLTSAQLGSGNAALGDMNVGNTADGGTVIQNY